MVYGVFLEYQRIGLIGIKQSTFSSFLRHPWRGLYIPLNQTTLSKAFCFGTGNYEMIENPNFDHFQRFF